MAGRFVGWKGDFRGFYLGLRANNHKVWFDAHRKEYEQEVKAPMVALLADLEEEFGAVSRLSRPNRDIRFTADKSPYKLNIYASLERGGYVSLDADSLVAAGGRYMVDDVQLKRLRGAIANERSGAELVRIVEALRRKGYEVEGRELKRVPPPYPRDHPRGELLRHKRVFYAKRWPVGPWIATARPREMVAGAWRDGAALNEWMRKHLGA